MQPTMHRRGFLSAGAALLSGPVFAAEEPIAVHWAALIHRARFDDLPAEVVERAKLCLLDNIAVLAYTTTLAASKEAVARTLSIGGPAEASVWGFAKKLPVEQAAYCMGYLIHGHEIDDSDFRGAYRPSCVCVAPALAMAEHTRASGRDLILALAIAYSVNGVLAGALNGLQGLGWMPSSVVGAAGGAAAAAKLMRLDAGQLQHALALGMVSGGGLFQYYYDQTEEKKLHVAASARTGIELAYRARHGWKGPGRAVEGNAGLVTAYLRGSGRKVDLARLRDAMQVFDGPLYIYPKFTACSAGIGPFLDALDPLWKREKVAVSDVAGFTVVDGQLLGGNFREKILHFEPPATVTGAQLNFNYTVSLFLHRGSASVYDFTEAALRDASVLALARNARFEEVPAGSESTLKIHLKNGRTITAPFRRSRGEKPEPELREMRMEKFERLTAKRLNDAGRKKTLELVNGVDRVKDTAEWVKDVLRLWKA
ncbi:MAG: MmgE/PrpD family protein [Acidobacteria bacterium]|nr:MmgE/PrpD family protein [Acidobacteriota bacterium]